MQKSILIVDDDQLLTKLYSLELETKNSFNVTSAKDGEDAINQMQNELPDLLLLDLRLPNVDGFEVLKFMSEQNYTFPVLIITNYDTHEYREKCAAHSNVREYLVKRSLPISMLSEKIKLHIGEEMAHD